VLLAWNIEFSATHITQSYGTVTASSVTPYILGENISFEVTTQGTIPLTPDAYISSTLAFGYAWLDSTSFPADAVAATIHPAMTDTSPDPNVWHTHNVTLDANGCVTSMPDLQSVFGTNDNFMPVNAMESTVVTPSTFQSTSSFEFVTDTTTCPAPLNGLRMVK